MGTELLDQAVCPGPVFVGDKVLAEEAYSTGRVVFQLLDRRERHPVTPEKVPHLSAGTDFREAFVLFFREHFVLPSGLEPAEPRVHGLIVARIASASIER